MEHGLRISGNLKKLQQGFTLIEFLVILGVLGILTTVTLSLINPQVQFAKARDGGRKGDLVKIQSALELYRSDESYYPPTLGLLSSSSPRYIQAVPTDPSGTVYGYTVSPSGCNNTTSFCTSYILWACLEYDDSKADVNRNPPGSELCTSPLKSYTVNSQ